MSDEKVKVKLNMDDLTFGELEEFERVTGLVMSDAVRTDIVRDKEGRPIPDPDDPRGRPLKETKMSARALMGMVYLGLLKENPDTTFEDVRKIKLSDVELDIEEDVDDDSGKEVENDS
jgi:small nuclear ribonucleoprotein (snRNP)-like protein